MALLFPLAYLIAAVMFIQGIRRLSKVRTAKSGNTLSATAMLIAIVVTMVIVSGTASWPYIIIGMVVGSLIGLVAAQKVADRFADAHAFAKELAGLLALAEELNG